MAKRKPQTGTDPKTDHKTDLHRTQEKPRESEERFRVAQELSPDGFTILRPVLDEHGQIIDFTWEYQNAAIAKLNATDQTAVVGQRVLELFPNHAETPFYKAYVQVAESGVPRVVEAQYQGAGMAEPRWLRVAVVRTGKDISIFGQDITERKQVEEALRESGERLRLAQEAARVGTFEWNLQTDRDVWTPELEAIHGLRPGEFAKTGAAWQQLVHPEDWANTMQLSQQSLQTGELTTGEWRVVWPDGSVHWLAGRWQVFRDASGRPLRMIGVNMDITERKRAEEALRDSESRYRTLFDSIQEGFYLGKVLFDNDGKPCDFIYLEVNPAFGRIMGLRREEIIGRRAKELIPGIKSSWLEAFSNVQLTGEPTRHDRYSEPLQRHFEAFAFRPVQGQFGVLVTDITERKQAEEAQRKQAEEALQMSEQEFHSLAEAMPQIVWATRPDGWNIYFNQQWVEYTGMTMEESCGHGWNAPFHPEDKQRAWESWQNAIQHNEPYALECRLRRADGVYRWWLVRGLPMLGANGEVLKWFGTCTDIEEIKRAEATLREANDLLERRVAERTMALRESEERLSFALQTIQTGAWDLDSADHTSFRSLEHDRIFGYAELLPEWTYEMFLDHVLPEDRPAVDAKFRQAMDTHGEWKFECRIRRATGEIRWIMAAGRHRSDATGAQRRMAGIVQDITTRKQAEEALKESEERFHAMFERHHAVKLMIEPETGAIVDANAAAYRFYGYSREQLCSLRIQDINQLPPDEVAAERAKAAAEQRNYFVFPHRLANGEVRWVEVYSTLVETRRRPLLYSIIHDVTDRARAEEALRESEERYRNLFDNMTEAFAVHEIVTDEHGRPSDYRFIEVNAAFEQMTGLNQRDILNRNVRDVLPEIEPFWIETYGRVALTREPVNFEHYYPAPLNRWYQVCAYCPAPGQFATVFWDVSSRKRAEQALQEANATLEHKVQERTSELSQRAAQLRALAGEVTLSEQRERSRLAKVLHDHLQQLLVAAKFRLTVLGRGGDDVVKQATKEVEELIDESIAASRSLTAELSPPILREAGLNAGLQWLARQMADKHGLFVNLEMEEHEPLSEPLKILLFESVRELLFNVVKHARTGSANVNLRRVDSHLQVTVSDQGAGFDMSIAGEEREGKGFGLFAMRERMGFMGGTLQTQSTPGQGSRFVLSVPFAPTEKIEPQSQGIFVPPEAHCIPSSVYPDPGKKIRVMLVDDHAVVRQGMANLLGDEPDIVVVGEAADGQEAVEIAARLLPDVILMDMSMPKLNGVEATRIIHNDWPAIRIIGLSMFEEADRAQAMRDAGAVHYLTKSGPAEELIKIIRTSVRSSN